MTIIYITALCAIILAAVVYNIHYDIKTIAIVTTNDKVKQKEVQSNIANVYKMLTGITFGGLTFIFGVLTYLLAVN